MSDKPHHFGHRQRVRERFLAQGLAGFQDYEALELLLMFVMKQADVKIPAKRLVDRFGSFKAVLDAQDDQLLAIEGVGPAAVTLIRYVKQAAGRYLQQTSRAEFSQLSPDSLVKYCISEMGALPNEQFRVICLDSKFAIVGEHVVADGTIDQAAVYPRKVIEIALAARATTLVFVHNHPNGDLTPSEFDKTLTRGLVLAAKTMNMTLYDHLIVSRDGHYSFRANRLL
jgi:DNA repair protein RadC